MKLSLVFLVLMAAMPAAAANSLANMAEMPEPAVLALTGTGLIMLGFVRKWFSRE